MQLITYQGRLAALAGTERAYLAPHLDRLPDTHPTKRFVSLLCLYAHELEQGRLPGEPIHYLPGRAQQYVRERLMPPVEFVACAHHSDHELAARFAVPLEQVAARRRDLRAPRPASSARSRRPPLACAGRRASTCA